MRSTTSPAANYLEAIEALSLADFIYRLKVCRKEMKESVHWLVMIQELNSSKINLSNEIKEGSELLKMLSKSVSTAEKNHRAQMSK